MTCDGDCADCARSGRCPGGGTADGLVADGGLAETEENGDAIGAGAGAGSADGTAATHTVEIVLDGDVTAVDCGADQPILDAAEDAGLELPNSCRGGSCTECVARLEEGDVDQSRAMGIDPMQKEEGYVLPCVATPNADCRLVADVQDELFDVEI